MNRKAGNVRVKSKGGGRKRVNANKKRFYEDAKKQANVPTRKYDAGNSNKQKTKSKNEGSLANKKKLRILKAQLLIQKNELNKLQDEYKNLAPTDTLGKNNKKFSIQNKKKQIQNTKDEIDKLSK